MLENYAGIKEWYDEGISVIDNHRHTEDKGIKVSLSTLKRYCKYYGISTCPGKIPISEWYNPQLSLRQNLEYARNSGIKTSQSALYSYCRQNAISAKGAEGQS